jgi:Tetracyclin repressor-like, C-terminal domain
VFLHELQALAPERQAEIIGDEHAYRRVFVALIEAGQRDGLIRPEVNPKLAALSILGSVNWVYRWFRPGGEFTARQIGEQFADLALRGIATPDALARLAPSPPAAEHPVNPVGKAAPLKPAADGAAPVKPAPVKPAAGGTAPVKPAADGADPAKTSAGARPSRSRAKTA